MKLLIRSIAFESSPQFHIAVKLFHFIGDKIFAIALSNSIINVQERPYDTRVGQCWQTDANGFAL